MRILTKWPPLHRLNFFLNVRTCTYVYYISIVSGVTKKTVKKPSKGKPKQKNIDKLRLEAKEFFVKQGRHNKVDDGKQSRSRNLRSKSAKKGKWFLFDIQYNQVWEQHIYAESNLHDTTRHLVVNDFLLVLYPIINE